MNNSIYKNAKQLVRDQAKELKRTNSDKPYIRYELNNLCDDMCKQFDWYAMKGTISEKQARIYSLWLASFTGDMHP
jgi:hypothetical protein